MARTRAALAGLAALLALGFGLAGCDGKRPTDRQPDAQVVASLPGDEITRFELRNEPAASGEAPALVLERVIDRKVLAAHARALHVEDDPVYLAALRRTREDLLVAGLRRQLLRDAGQPAAPALRDFVANRPWLFAKRQVVELEDGAGARHALDTAALDRAQWLALTAQPGWSGRGRIVMDGEAFRIVAMTPRAVDAVQDRDLAVRLWQREQVDRALQGVIGAARSSGAVRYSPGTGPAAR